MTHEDVCHREAIRALVTRYNINGDRARFDGLAACFAEDGTLDWTTGSGTGRADIVKGLTSTTRGSGSDKSITVIRHNLTTMHIELGEDRTSATGRIYFFVLSNAGPDHAGVYVDRYARVGDEWLIAARQVRIDWRAPVSVYAAPE
jgi:hypothetical protein